MAKIVVLGAGISGHTAAAFIKKKLGKQHDVVVVSPNSYYQWIPSNIWVGVGRMNVDQVRFKLKKVYDKWEIDFKQAKAVSIHPDGNQEITKGFVSIEYTDPERKGETEQIDYDYLVNATGPKLNFEGTPGLGPGKNTESVCSCDHAIHAWEKLQACFKKMEAGEKQTFLIGTGHSMATCQGAAFEYILNVSYEIRKRKLEHLAELIWITNEYELGDFGMGGAFIKRGGYITSTKVFAESFLIENGIKWIKRAGVFEIEPGKANYETLDGEKNSVAFDFSMLIPGFSGVGLKAFGKNNEDITSTVFAPNGFTKVDADYTTKDFEEWKAADWPETYRNPTYPNIFAPGIAFAPPHSISKPMKSKNGTAIFPAPPRTGMPSGVSGKVVALNIVNLVKKGEHKLKHRASMAKMGAACIVSAGFGMTKGSAATMTVYPIVQDWDKYPEWGRSIKYTMGEPGLAGHWLKWTMHYMFLHKAKGYPFWWLLPE
ncbi:NAD(P)/FAD-dependent oxidoreductase [Labilibaculum euxinus]|uniref:NAD(P)/FAD-dependent oxidoreductase n=1 Tax=Labilibaculum euxinus TaxID=2686357 RepID=A0A7M4DBH6_9BACT|nr:FAD-dependent oxidoreductase [Labilibaculum euxinus]MUP40005.1 NAD(P)/FAD-dependent oxidoreductase [Labilibaculum euxinus]MVB09210.1 NAD(P)/FAD-dependent oxidoreductase [Labilibaculum euxinus]